MSAPIIDLTIEYSNALDSLKKALELHDTRLESDSDLKKALRDGCIQRFEYCIELSWKTAMKCSGLKTTFPKTAIREMARNDLIENSVIWLEFIDARNETSHSYDEEVAESVFKSIRAFVPEAEKLLVKLRALL